MSVPVVSAVVEPAQLPSVDLLSYDGPRICAADFFTRARQGRPVTTLPPFRDGHCVLFLRGTEWMRMLSQWIAPGQPSGVILPDGVVTGWWRTRTMPGSRFARLHRLIPTRRG